jgi:hypothetical protein
MTSKAKRGNSLFGFFYFKTKKDLF